MYKLFEDCTFIDLQKSRFMDVMLDGSILTQHE